MPSPALDSEARERLRADLEALDCVRRAVVDADPLRVYIVCDRAESPTDMLVSSVLARAGVSAGDAEVHLAYLAPPEQRQRVRFVSARMTTPRSGRAAAEVELEWGAQSHSERAEGEASPPLELRLAATATLRALEGILRDRVRFSLLGIKSFRVFDTDVVVVLMRTDQGAPLVGAALASGDPHRAAALAVLNATNRVLGNYLSHSNG
jgi:hypothetical protein